MEELGPKGANTEDTAIEAAPGSVVSAPRTRDEIEAARRLLASSRHSDALGRLVQVTARLLGTTSAQVSILTEVQTVAAAVGPAAADIGRPTSLDDSICTLTDALGIPVIVNDALADPRVSSLPPVVSGAVRAYLGVPLRPEGHGAIGVLCVYDDHPRRWTSDEVALLEQVAALAVVSLEMAALSDEYEADRDRWELAIEAAGIGSFDLEILTGRLSWDDRLVALFGHDRDGATEELGDFHTQVHPDDLARVMEARRQAIDQLGTFESEYRILLPDGRTRWVQARGRVFVDEAGRAVRLLGAAVDTTGLRAAEAHAEQVAVRTALLGQVTAQLGGTLDAVEGAARLAKLVVPALAQWCVVSLVDDDSEGPLGRRIRDVASWHVDRARLAAVDTYARLRLSSLIEDSFLQRSLVRGETIPVSSDATAAVSAVLEPGPAQDLIHELAPEHALILPMRVRDRNVGLLTLFRGADDGPFSPADRKTADDAAALAAVALDNARLYGQQQALAEGLQRSLLTDPPKLDGAEVAVRYEPAAEAAQVGGDWYDAFVQEQGSTVLVIGDVVGHDTAAAAAMGQLRSLARGIAVTTSDGPAEVLGRLDRAMALLQVDTTATAAIVRLDRTPAERASGLTRVHWSSAGHPPPLVVAADGAVSVLGSRTGEADLLLGVNPTTARNECEMLVAGGATVLLYTDGLVERRQQSFDVGVALLADTVGSLAGLAVDELCDRVLAMMVPDAHEDDVALVALRLAP